MDENKIELTQEDLEMGKYIYSILKCSGNIILTSWGFHFPVGIRLGLRFKVNGFKHQGYVDVKYNEGADLFDIYLINEDDTLKDLKEGIYFDQLVEVIDNEVELVSNYTDRVNKEYNIINDGKDI